MNTKEKAAKAATIETRDKDTQNIAGTNSDLVRKEIDDFDKGLDTPKAQKLEELRIFNSANIPAPETIIEKDGIPLCCKGDFSILVGNPGTRKSWLCISIVAAYFMDDGFLGFNRVGEKGVLLWIDTEQGKARTAQTARRLNKILGLSESKDIESLVLLDFREQDFKQRKEYLENAIEIYKPQFAIIDGLADLITDTNDPEQSCNIVLNLMQITAKYNIHILAVVHSNVGANDKARGHLGSEALRKCETAIHCKISPDGESTNCTYQKTRNKRPEDFNFNIRDEIPTLCQCTPKDVEKRTALESLFSILLTNEPKVTHTELVNALVENGVCERTARNKINAAKKCGIIDKANNGLYYLLKQDLESRGKG